MRSPAGASTRAPSLFEDDPYRDLAYEPCDRRPVAARMGGGSWIYQGSFSKTFAPGLRLGFLAASADLFPPLVMLKQSVDLHSSRLSQLIVHDAITAGDWTARLDELVAFYRARRDTFEEILSRHFGDLARWRTPSGGLFYWLRSCTTRTASTRGPCSTKRSRAASRSCPAKSSTRTNPSLGTMRLNFSHADAGEADRGLRVLADLIREQRP